MGFLCLVLGLLRSTNGVLSSFEIILLMEREREREIVRERERERGGAGCFT